MRHVITALLGAAALSVVWVPAALSGDRAAPAYSWEGFYVGGNVGYGSSNIGNDFAFSDPLLLIGQTATLVGSDSNGIKGAIGGGQFGYNWQVNSYLLGIEADLQVSGQENSTTFNGSIITPTAVNPTAITYSNKLEWFSTLRGRLGFISGPWLMYGSGGLAVGRLNTNGMITPAFAGFTNLPGAWDQSTTKIGWTIGVGVENSITSNWSWKVEYLYLDLGSVTGSAALPVTNCYGVVGNCANPSVPGTANITSKFTDNIVRIGFNYKLGN
jgi:outer membrane immunogenic protein